MIKRKTPFCVVDSYGQSQNDQHGAGLAPIQKCYGRSSKNKIKQHTMLWRKSTNNCRVCYWHRWRYSSSRIARRAGIFKSTSSHRCVSALQKWRLVSIFAQLPPPPHPPNVHFGNIFSTLETSRPFRHKVSTTLSTPKEAVAKLTVHNSPCYQSRFVSYDWMDPIVDW